MSEFVKTKKEFNKKPFNGNKDIKEGSEFILDIKRLGINGEGIGFYNRLAVFVDGAIPGEGHCFHYKAWRKDGLCEKHRNKNQKLI